MVHVEPIGGLTPALRQARDWSAVQALVAQTLKTDQAGSLVDSVQRVLSRSMREANCQCYWSFDQRRRGWRGLRTGAKQNSHHRRVAKSSAAFGQRVHTDPA